MRLYPLKLHLKHDIFHCILLFIVDRFFFSFFFFLPPTPRLFVIFLPSLSTDEHRFFLEQSLRFPSNFRRNSIPSRLLHAHFFPPVIYLYHRRTMILFTLIYPRCSFASPPSFSTASPIRSTVFTLLYYSILFRSSIFTSSYLSLLSLYLFLPPPTFSTLPIPLRMHERRRRTSVGRTRDAIPTGTRVIYLLPNITA